jgi:hypothetical protein
MEHGSPITQDMVTSYGRQTTEKAVIKLQTDTLEFGENLISIEVRDMTGNKGTFEVRVNVSQNGFVRNLNNFPNPFENQTIFRFDYHAPRQGATALMSIYTSTGQLVRTLHKDITIGMNELLWDGFDNNGNSLTAGAYYYVLRIDADLYVDTNAGKILMIK